MLKRAQPIRIWVCLDPFFKKHICSIRANHYINILTCCADYHDMVWYKKQFASSILIMWPLKRTVLMTVFPA